MDYLEILEKKKRLSENAGEQERQEAMEYGIRMAVEETNDPPRIHEMMKKSFVACSEKERWLTIAYEVEEWELNPIETMHGGLIATAIDASCGILVRYLSGTLRTPTVSMTINYLATVPAGERLLVTVRAVKVGRSLVNLCAEAVLEKSKKTAATATAVFFPIS